MNDKKSETRELTPDELEKVSGGGILSDLLEPPHLEPSLLANVNSQAGAIAGAAGGATKPHKPA